MQGTYAIALKAVGNAVPLLLGWAILGAVFEAAYGTPAPKPDFIVKRPPWEGAHIIPSLHDTHTPADQASIVQVLQNARGTIMMGAIAVHQSYASGFVNTCASGAVLLCRLLSGHVSHLSDT